MQCITLPPQPPLGESMKEGKVSEEQDERASERESKASMSSKIRGAALFASAQD